MKKGLVIVLGLLMTLGAVSSATAGDTFVRYKMTVTVATPEGDKTGSAVRIADRHTEMSILPQQGGTTYNVGEGQAVVVNLGKRGVLFALMGGQKEAQEVFSLFSKDKGTKRIVLSPAQYPMFVTFKDPKKPNTVKAISPYNDHDIQVDGGTAKTVEDILGKGVKLKEVSINETSDPVTRGIEKLLPWIPEYYSRMLDGQRFNTIYTKNPIANSLASGVFKVGGRK